MKAFVTGGAGFIGSHIVDKLMKEYDKNKNQVVVYDNLCTGQKSFLQEHIGKSNFQLIEADVLDYQKLKESMKGSDFVFHLQANADVRGGIKNTKIDLEQNILATHNVLEAMRESNIKKLLFSSSGTVYGEPKKFPTHETSELIQTSLYGASKASAESIIQAYCEYFEINSWIFRFVSFIGERYTHGVIFDFMKKLKENPSQLEILGDGTQRKSYLHVQDGVNAMFTAIKKAKDKKNIFNVGHNDYVNVVKVADLICDEMGLSNITYKFTGGDRGWVGDQPFVHLDVTKLKTIGWKPTISIERGIRRTVKYLKDNEYLLYKRILFKK